MTTPSPLQAMKVPGQLLINPGTITDPASGTSLGFVRDVVLLRRTSVHEVVAAEHGLEPVDALRLGERWSMTFALRGFDADAIAACFPSNAFTGATAGRPGLRYPGTSEAGSLISGDSVVLRFTPDDPTRHPGVVFYRALPVAAQELQIDLGHTTELLLLVGFLGIRDASQRLVEVQLVEDMTP